MADLTLEDIAARAGVSRSTVSRVVNGQDNVSEDVRRRVLEIIQKTGYQPHPAARSLASQRSWTIGLVLPHSVSFLFFDPYYPHLIKGVSQGCNQSDYTFALFIVGTKEDEEKIFPRVSRKGLLDGVLVQSGHHGDQKIISRLQKTDIPLVVIGRPFHTDNVSYVDVDNTNAANVAASHLIQLGHKRIATITGPANSTVGIDRKEGYLKAMVERGREVDESLIVEGDFTETGGYYAMQRLLPEEPDAVFVASDIMAFGAVRAVQEAGLTVPDDVAIVGFDDLPITSFSDIRLTTVRQPVVQFGVKAVEVLIDLIQNGIQPPRRIIMDTELVIRDSCGANRIKHA